MRSRLFIQRNTGQPNRPPACRRAAFTLIEMLVVIAILALLAVLMIPAVNRGLETARNTKCMNNLRTLSQAGLMYASEHGGRLIAAETKPHGQPATFWMENLAPYIGSEELNDSQRRRYLPCPKVGFTRWNWGYGMNIRPLYPANDRQLLDRFNQNGSRHGYTKAFYIYEIAHPDQRLYLVDSLEWQISGIPGHHGFLPFGRHERERVNASFFDGSARSLNYEQAMKALNPKWDG
ncbi:MAG: prepilin-type N-terminal cleavage/methylation domain-containing protein [Verrucomicrobia bacterium]|nr:prepilin-type N-terminal cleavage/methylation domain-containing protein [Verrucomicrobiota bacterium]MCH8528029.1 type II secretion system GspH family protein [Kiritimatiellia bacterium]